MSEWMANTVGVFVIILLVIATVADLIVSATLLNVISHVLRDKHEAKVERSLREDHAKVERSLREDHASVR